MVNCEAGQCEVQKKEFQINSEWRKLASMIEELSDCVGKLEERLVPVTRPSAPRTNEEDVAKEQQLVPMASDIRNHRIDITESVKHLRDLVDRLEFS